MKDLNNFNILQNMVHGCSFVYIKQHLRKVFTYMLDFSVCAPCCMWDTESFLSLSYPSKHFGSDCWCYIANSGL